MSFNALPLSPTSPPDVRIFSLAFDQLPTEINEHIASCLDSDKDIQNFRLICQATNVAVTHYRCGLWRELYARRYDVRPGMKGVDVRMTYMIRTKFLRRIKHCFYIGQEYRELVCLEKLRDLVVESFAGVAVGYKGRHSNNLQEIRRFLTRSKFLDKVLSPIYRRSDMNPLMLTLQLVFTHWQLDLSIRSLTYGFGYSKHAVYGSPEKYPLFLDEDCMNINTMFLLHIVNFFKYHLTTEKEDTLFKAYSQLENSQKPRAWDGPLQQGRGIPGVKKLGRHWKGSYAYLDPQAMEYIRSLQPEEGRDPVDNINADDGFQTLDLDSSHEANTVPWPRAFETHLHALPTNELCKKLHNISKPKIPRLRPTRPLFEPDMDTGLKTPPESPTTGAPRQQFPHAPHTTPNLPPTPTSPPPVLYPKKGYNFLQFSGSGVDAEPYLCSGIVHPIPPQSKIPGWQRVTMMKYFGSDKPKKRGSNSSHNPFTTPPADEDDEDDDIEFDDDVDIDGSCWCYEGVVLPGGMIMVGRWWSPVDTSEDMECVGPFIFWNVEEPWV